MKITIILGSVRENRKSDKVATFLNKLLSEMDGIKTRLLDLKDYSFPVMEERFRNLENPPSGMAEFSTILAGSDGIIIISPEYNGSYSGALKNALDYFKQEYVKKAMSVVTVSSGVMGGVNASHHLLSWILHVKAFPSPFKLMVKNVESLFDENGAPLDASFEKRAQVFLTEFIWFSKAISNAV